MVTYYFYLVTVLCLLKLLNTYSLKETIERCSRGRYNSMFTLIFMRKVKSMLTAYLKEANYFNI